MGTQQLLRPSAWMSRYKVILMVQPLQLKALFYAFPSFALEACRHAQSDTDRLFAELNLNDQMSSLITQTAMSINLGERLWQQSLNYRSPFKAKLCYGGYIERLHQFCLWDEKVMLTGETRKRENGYCDVQQRAIKWYYSVEMIKKQVWVHHPFVIPRWGENKKCCLI